jgi:hypothetical protein
VNPEKIIIRYEQVDEQVEGSVRRIIGFVRARNMLTLFDAADLEANPREAKSGAVTADIIESIIDTPETFPFKTKGILVGTANYESLQRNRYELRFENSRVEGILDGGHNMLAIGTYILSRALNDKKLLSRIKSWSEFKDAWKQNRGEVTKLKADETSSTSLDFLVPIEILVPSDLDDEGSVENFVQSLHDICAARNHNVELREETKANQKGYYAELRKSLPASIRDRVEWKTNDGGEIKVRDLVALAWIPLSVLSLPDDMRVAAKTIYSSKGKCVEDFNRLMSHELVSKATTGDYTHELHNSAIGSALAIAGQIPALYDKIYIAFPSAYNGDGDGRFGSRSGVKLAREMRSKPTTHFTSMSVEYAYPDGLIMPLVYGLKALMSVNDKGHLVWNEDPSKFIDECLDSIVRKYRVLLNAFLFDPQKVAKSEGSYELVLDAYETELLKRREVVQGGQA